VVSRALNVNRANGSFLALDQARFRPVDLRLHVAELSDFSDKGHLPHGRTSPGQRRIAAGPFLAVAQLDPVAVKLHREADATAADARRAKESSDFRFNRGAQGG
jgi:hypothetical protein